METAIWKVGRHTIELSGPLFQPCAPDYSPCIQVGSSDLVVEVHRVQESNASSRNGRQIAYSCGSTGNVFIP